MAASLFLCSEAHLSWISECDRDKAGVLLMITEQMSNVKFNSMGVLGADDLWTPDKAFKSAVWGKKKKNADVTYLTDFTTRCARVSAFRWPQRSRVAFWRAACCRRCQLFSRPCIQAAQRCDLSPTFCSTRLVMWCGKVAGGGDWNAASVDAPKIRRRNCRKANDIVSVGLDVFLEAHSCGFCRNVIGILPSWLQCNTASVYFSRGAVSVILNQPKSIILLITFSRLVTSIYTPAATGGEWWWRHTLLLTDTAAPLNLDWWHSFKNSVWRRKMARSRW